MLKPVKTSRLLLREFVQSDWQAVYEYSSDPLVSQFMDWGPNSVREAKEFIKRTTSAATNRPRLAYDLAITKEESDHVIGAVGLLLTGNSRQQASIGYVLSRQYWGVGIATEAVAAMLQFGFDSLKLHRISATCDSQNVASYRVMEKCGLRREGQFLEDKFVKGRWRNTLSYSILNREWQNIEWDI